MELLTLFNRAVAAGLSIAVADSQLRITGPREAESLAQQLGKHKPELLEVWLTNWPRTVEDLLARIDNQELRSDLHDTFDETAAFLEFEQRISTKVAEFLAFSELMSAMHARGIDVPANHLDSTSMGKTAA